MLKLKTKKCKVCKTEFEYFNTTQKVCSTHCAIKFAKQQEKKIFKAETKKLKQRLKTKKEWLKEAQTAFNEYIRTRDKGMPCISCGTTTGQRHAGHYKTVGAHPELRFHPFNCHIQCATCNNHLSGNIINYRKTLINRIGEKNLKWLEGPHNSPTLTIDDIEEIKAYYKSKTQYLKNNPMEQWMTGLEDYE